jgi:hypothetical protein
MERMSAPVPDAERNDQIDGVSDDRRLGAVSDDGCMEKCMLMLSTDKHV